MLQYILQEKKKIILVLTALELPDKAQKAGLDFQRACQFKIIKSSLLAATTMW